MGTKWATVMTQYTSINDERLAEEARTTPALYFASMAGYMKIAIPGFTNPPGMQDYLACAAARMAVEDYISPKGSSGETVIASGKQGYDICSAAIVGEDDMGNPVFTPTDVIYDGGAGTVTYSGNIAKGEQISMYFYADGEFENELTPEIMRILGLGIQLAWESRYIADWLNRTPKVQDKTFALPNGANQERADTERIRMLREQFIDEMRRFEENLAYRNFMAKSDKAFLKP